MEKVTVEYDVYTFDELSEEAKEKALETWNANNDYMEIIDTFVELLESLNLPNAKIYYSGFWSQGDGLCFEMSASEMHHIDLNVLEKSFPKEYWEWAHQFAEKMNCVTAIKEDTGVVVTSTHRGQYYHENSVIIDVEPLEVLEEWRTWEKTEEVVIRLFRKLMSEMYAFLEKNYNYYSSMECFQEIAKGNEWRFLKNGEQFD